MLSRSRTRLGLTAVAAIAATGLLGCRTSAPDFTPTALEAARAQLMQPLPGDPAALYRLRVPTVGGLRMAVLTSGTAGRLTVSESMGSAISVTAWTGAGGGLFYDMREGCRLESADLSRVLGIGALPLPQAVLLLAGRLPAAAGDTVSPTDDGLLLITGEGWSAEVRVASEPWRVMTVREIGNNPGWSIVLGNHTNSVPGSVRLTTSRRRWAELELIRLEWHDGGELPALPVMPWCVVDDDS
jgi:hypothetical protein